MAPRRSKVHLSCVNILPWPSCFQICAPPNNSFILGKSGGLRSTYRCLKGAQEAPSRSKVNLGAQMVSCGPGPGPGHQPKWTWRFGDSDFMRWYFTAQVLQLKSPLLFSSPGLAVYSNDSISKYCANMVCPLEYIASLHVTGV